MSGLLCRCAREVELSAQAAVHAEALFGDDSLVVVSLRICESDSLVCLSVAESSAENAAPLRRSWAMLLSLIPLLLRRLEANTLLPGILREEELEYDAHVQAEIYKAKNEPLPSCGFFLLASTLGYTTLLRAMARSLDLLKQPLWRAAQVRLVESFVLQGLDVIPRTAGVPADLVCAEDRGVMAIEKFMSPRHFEPTFCAAVLRKWRSEPVSSVLRARGVLQAGVSWFKANDAEFEARQRFDVAKHGLRKCALPSCHKAEKTAKELQGARAVAPSCTAAWSTRRRTGTCTDRHAPTLLSTGCVTAPSPPALRQRRRSRSSRGAPAAAPWCTVAWNTKRWTGGRTKKLVQRKRRRFALRRRAQTVGQGRRDGCCRREEPRCAPRGIRRGCLRRARPRGR